MLVLCAVTDIPCKRMRTGYIDENRYIFNANIGGRLLWKRHAARFSKADELLNVQVLFC